MVREEEIFSFEIDGAVVKVNSLAQRELLWHDNKNSTLGGCI